MSEKTRSAYTPGAYPEAAAPVADPNPTTKFDRAFTEADPRWDLPVFRNRAEVKAYLDAIGISHISIKALKEAMRVGDLEHFKIGNRYSCSPRNVHEWLAGFAAPVGER